MCYSDKDLPPDAPGAHSTAHGHDLVLTSSDSNQFLAYLTHPSAPTGTAVIIYPDVRGLHQFYKELALRLAEVGVTALAIDYFGRTAGLTTRDDSFEYVPHVQQLQLDGFKLDVAAAIAKLRETMPDAPIFVIGFCMGGALTLQSATEPTFGFAGVMPFYAGLKRAFGGQGTALENADKIVYPVLGQFGGADQGIPESDVNLLAEALDKANVEHKIIIYPGAPHSFFDRKATDFAQASTEAWQQVLAFIQSHTPAHSHVHQH